jgi:hypothetical protein
MTTDLQTIDTSIPTGMALRDPQVIMEEAKKRCIVLTEMIEQTKSYKEIGKKRHLYVEAWITLAQFYGCTGRIVRTEDIEIHGVLGFKAHAQVVHDQTGTVLSSAESICMKDEENWGTRPKYEWQNGERVQVGEEQVPLHQVMSMAQTRALSKALAAKFRWIVVLGGWSATPAEEMTGNEHPTELKATKKAKPLAKFPYGKHKGVAIDHADVTVDDLTWWINRLEGDLREGKNKQYERSNKEFLVALQQELVRRQQEPVKEPIKEPVKEPEKKEQLKTDRQPMDDDAWVDACLLWFEQDQEVYSQAADEFKVKDPSRLASGRRNAFQDRIKELSQKNK